MVPDFHCAGFQNHERFKNLNLLAGTLILHIWFGIIGIGGRGWIRDDFWVRKKIKKCSLQICFFSSYGWEWSKNWRVLITEMEKIIIYGYDSLISNSLIIYKKTLTYTSDIIYDKRETGKTGFLVWRFRIKHVTLRRRVWVDFELLKIF